MKSTLFLLLAGALAPLAAGEVAEIHPLGTAQLAHKTGRVAVVQFTGPWNCQVPTWANTRERRWVLVRMSQTAGTVGQVSFQTEHEPWFNGEKFAAFAVIPDGVIRDDIIDLGGVTCWNVEAFDSLLPGAWTPLHDGPLVVSTEESF